MHRLSFANALLNVRSTLSGTCCLFQPSSRVAWGDSVSGSERLAQPGFCQILQGPGLVASRSFGLAVQSSLAFRYDGPALLFRQEETTHSDLLRKSSIQSNVTSKNLERFGYRRVRDFRSVSAMSANGNLAFREPVIRKTPQSNSFLLTVGIEVRRGVPIEPFLSALRKRRSRVGFLEGKTDSGKVRGGRD